MKMGSPAALKAEAGEGATLDDVFIQLTGGSSEDFLARGILAQSVMFIAIFYGLSAIWERDSGVLAKYLVSPAPRWALVVGRAPGI
ncbi:MAG TPA: hypothetical protein VMV63_04880 [Acidithiobacillus sp.]|nr:hypothetical protein [Acidithiobacillus sp.]